MPGPGRVYGPALADAVRDGDVDEALLDAQVRRLLGVLDRVGALDDDPGAPERSEDRPEHRALAREAAAASFVLLRNEGVLPLDPGALGSLAVLGPNADRAQVMGGGSAKLRPHYTVTPLEALREHLPGVEIRHERGCDIDRTAPELRAPWRIEFDGSEPAAERDTGLLLFDAVAGDERIRYVARAAVHPVESGPHTFALRQAGRARLLVDGEAVLDGFTDPPPRGETMIGLVSEEISAEVPLTAGEPVERRRRGHRRGRPGTLRGAVIGLRPPDPGDLIERAAAAAAGCDAAVLVVGTTDEWESEGQDRTSMDLPGDQDALVEAVLDANPDTIVVVNAASPVDDALGRPRPRGPGHLVRRPGDGRRARGGADGRGRAGRPPADHPAPAARAQPVVRQLPRRERRGPLRRGRPDGLPLVRRPRACPCASRSATASPTRRFEIGEPRAGAAFAPGGTLAVEVDVTNTRDRAGSEVVQLYVEPPAERARPPATGAARLREGPPGAGRVHDRLARAHRPGLRLLGPGRPELGRPPPPGRGLPDDPRRRGAPHHGRLEDRPGDLRPARRPLVGRPPPRRPDQRRLRQAHPPAIARGEVWTPPPRRATG